MVSPETRTAVTSSPGVVASARRNVPLTNKRTSLTSDRGSRRGVAAKARSFVNVPDVQRCFHIALLQQLMRSTLSIRSVPLQSMSDAPDPEWH